MNNDSDKSGSGDSYLTQIAESLLKQPPEIPDERLLTTLAHHYWEVGRINECLACVQLIEQRDKVTSLELHFRGYWELYTGDAQAAFKTFTSALQQDKDDLATRLGYAYALFYSMDYQSAATVFQQLANDGAPLNSPPIMAAASRAMAAGQRPAEIQMAPLPGLPAGLGDVLQLRVMQGTPGAIRELLVRKQRLAPTDRLPLDRLLVELYLDEGQDLQALNLLEELMKTYPSDGPLYFFKGIALRRFGRKEESHESFGLAVAFAPLDARAWGGLAAGWLELGQPQKGIDAYGVAIFLDAANPSFWGDLGTAESALEHYEAGSKALSKSIELGMANFSNYFNRGLCALKLDNPQAAMRDWQLAIATEPDHPRASEAAALIKEIGGEAADTRFVFGDDQ
ncbi:MAG TPA: hypothetical protein VGN90_15310 [Pyrinomonadaceae bacterium]|jgi:tetratricopeptide (TPR) repeat protein|nr:hypothetical protein [Pyrinomonadaceae bacterium]